MKLIPPDLQRCQTEWLGGSFMTFGPRSWVRCDAKPTTLALERAKPNGSMSLCDKHVQPCREKLGRKVSFSPLPLNPARRIRRPKL